METLRSYMHFENLRGESLNLYIKKSSEFFLVFHKYNITNTEPMNLSGDTKASCDLKVDNKKSLHVRIPSDT